MSVSFKVGSWTVNPDSNEITDGDQTHKLDHKIMQLFEYFAQNPNLDLSKERILKAVWGSEIVSEEVLTVAVSNLRKALGDNPTRPVYIKTVPRYGYRMLQSEEVPPEPKSTLGILHFLEERVGLRFLVIAGILFTFLLGIVIFLLRVKHLH